MCSTIPWNSLESRLKQRYFDSILDLRLERKEWKLSLAPLQSYEEVKERKPYPYGMLSMRLDMEKESIQAEGLRRVVM